MPKSKTLEYTKRAIKARFLTDTCMQYCTIMHKCICNVDYVCLFYLIIDILFSIKYKYANDNIHTVYCVHNWKNILIYKYY